MKAEMRQLPNAHATHLALVHQAERHEQRLERLLVHGLPMQGKRGGGSASPRFMRQAETASMAGSKRGGMFWRSP